MASEHFAILDLTLCEVTRPINAVYVQDADAVWAAFRAGPHIMSLAGRRTAVFRKPAQATIFTGIDFAAGHPLIASVK